MKYLYLILHILTVAYPLANSFEHRIKYASKWKALLPGLLITAAFFILWDVIFTRAGVWGFNHQYITGIKLFSLPIEEWLFFITVPFASVFIYECVIYFLPNVGTSQNLKIFTWTLAGTLIILAVSNPNQAYTFWNFLFCGIFLAFIAFKHPPWLGKFYVAYLFHLLPFFLVNGVLTGSFIEEEVVWYNNNENFAFRLFTIPVEDTIYAMLLLLLNIYFFELFKKKLQPPT